MRYLGNKTKLLSFIDEVINKYDIKGEVFADLFTGTASVADYFKDRYNVIANDYMGYSSMIAKAKLLNENIPTFKKFRKKYECSPFDWFNEKRYEPNNDFFVYKNYSPEGNRMYFTEENAIKIDGIRTEIEGLYKDNILSESEYAFLIASLIESVLKISNTTGTYQAYLKFWESRSVKELVLEPLDFNSCPLYGVNEVYNENINKLVRKISGDIAYLDPPYTITQYTNSYHVLETITRYDYPELFGKTGRRVNRELSGYSNKQQVYYEFEDLLRQIDFEHIIISYSNQSLISLEELVGLAKRFAVNEQVHIETSEYREYATNNLSYKGDKKNKLKEAIIYFRKDRKINKSPLNYSGSKDPIMPMLIKQLPKHIGTFVDAMGGAFNVGANVVSLNKTYYCEYNQYIFEIVKLLVETDSETIIRRTKEIIEKYGLCKKNKEAYLKLRQDYNELKDPMLLFVLQIYAFQNMIRFNNSQKMNTPVGNNEFCEGIEERIKAFRIKSDEYELICQPYSCIEFNEFPMDTLFYFDPPYFITNAEYNDGKRGLEGWNSNNEMELLNFLLSINRAGYKFMLSNVVNHNGKIHHVLLDWIKEHKFNMTIIGKTGIKYPREEVVVTNYDIWEGR